MLAERATRVDLAVDMKTDMAPGISTRRRGWLLGGLALLAAHNVSIGQSVVTTRRVGFLAFSSEATSAHLRAAFTQGMQDLGWLDGKNVEYGFAYAEGDVYRLNALANELIEHKVDVILVGSSQTAAAAHQATKTIPIVLAGVGNAVGAGLVASLANPGGNVTGFTSQQDEVLGKLIGILHEIVPAARRITILLNESNPLHAEYWARAQSACAALHLVPLRVVASTPAQLGAAVREIVRQRSQGVVVSSDSMYFSERAKLQELMQTTRLPAVYALRDSVTAGGLLSYGYDTAANYRNAAKYVDRILKGASPADLPVEQATKFDLVVNLKTAKSLGITIPKDILVRADDVIQ